jgi:hypothetical protein
MTTETNKAERMAYAGEYMVPTEVARKLERERNEAQQDLAELCARYNELIGVKEPQWYNGREIPADIREETETEILYNRLLAENPGYFIHLEEFLELARRLERERDEWAAMCGRYKQERDEARLDKRGG